MNCVDVTFVFCADLAISEKSKNLAKMRKKKIQAGKIKSKCLTDEEM